MARTIHEAAKDSSGKQQLATEAFTCAFRMHS